MSTRQVQPPIISAIKRSIENLCIPYTDHYMNFLKMYQTSELLQQQLQKWTAELEAYPRISRLFWITSARNSTHLGGPIARLLKRVGAYYLCG